MTFTTLHYIIFQLVRFVFRCSVVLTGAQTLTERHVTTVRAVIGQQQSRLISQVAGSRLSVTASISSSCHVYVLLHHRQCAIQQTTEASLAQTCVMSPVVGSY